MTQENPVLWSPTPQQINQSNLNNYKNFLQQENGLSFADYDALHSWSISEPGAFWRSIHDYAGVISEQDGDIALENADDMFNARYFPGMRLNYAQNLLRHTGNAETADNDAIVFRGEDKVLRRLSWAELQQQVSSLEQFLRAKGVQPGDRVAAMLPNMPESMIGMLACAAIGAVWASCSPEFGLQGLQDRFGQIEPVVLIACDGYFYNGKQIDVRDKSEALAESIPSLQQIIVVDYVGLDVSGLFTPAAIHWQSIPDEFPATDIDYQLFDFNHPLFILFSSGTTGKPKCIMHGAGGTLLQHLKEHSLHSDIRAGDRVFYFTTCTWMMWNWLVSSIAVGATVLLYDGSPFYPGKTAVLDYLQDEKATFFGTSAKYIDELKKSGVSPKSTHDLSAIRTIASTGSPLLPDSFEYVYKEIKEDVCLASIAGGTDIISCFVLGNPALPVRRSEIQCKGLGMAIEAWDDEGKPADDNKGELVCTVPFPSMPVGFWNDADRSRYHAAYFDKFPGVWAHGDLAEITANNGVIIHGRSDATLNPGGVRIGTAELYRQVEVFPEVRESMAIGQQFDGDVRIILFVVMNDGAELNEEFVVTLKKSIRAGASPRHVPAKIIEVAELPRTASGKIVEIAVRDIVHGREVKNKTALANPEALEQFKHMTELEQA